MVVKTEIIHMKERGRYSFYLCSDKSDLKGFQRNFQTFFSQLSVPIWHLSIRERVRKKAHVHFWKIIRMVLVWQKTQVQELSWQFFLQNHLITSITESIIHFQRWLVYEEYLCKFWGKNLWVNSNVCFKVVGVCSSARRKQIYNTIE